MSLKHPLLAPVTLLSRGQTSRPLALSAGEGGELTEAVEDSVVLTFGRSLPCEGALISSNPTLETLLPELQRVLFS